MTGRACTHINILIVVSYVHGRRQQLKLGLLSCTSKPRLDQITILTQLTHPWCIVCLELLTSAMIIKLFDWQYIVVQAGYLGTVWRYSVSWYQDPAQLDNMVLVSSKARDVTRQLSVSTWTSSDHVLSAQVMLGDQPVVGADIRLTLQHVDTNGQHQTSVQNISLYDDGAAGKCHQDMI